MTNKAAPERPPIDPNQKDAGMKCNRASFQTLQKQTRSTSGAMKDRSTIEKVADRSQKHLDRAALVGTFAAPMGLREPRSSS
jgi:hypothetical protein